MPQPAPQLHPMPESTVASAGAAAALLNKLNNRTARVGVVGLGYVGLPLAVEFARAGFHTTGIDLDARKVDAINRGESYIADVPTPEVAAFHKAGKLGATVDASAIAHLDTINICVPTPLRKTKDPDLSYVVAAVEVIAAHLRRGQLVILESTTYPGTTDEVVQPILERGGLKAGVDFFLAFSPERVDPGNEKWTTKNVPKVVGGVTPECTTLAKALYSASIDTVIEVSSPKVAEMVKLLENTFRAVNIGLVNELALMCDRIGVNVWEVVDAAATKPFGFMPFYPGPGLGGHCIPIDPFYLTWKAREFNIATRFIELAGEVNTAMPQRVVEKTVEALNERAAKAMKGARILVIGIAYKKNVDDTRESPALTIIELLEKRGAEVSFHDPFFDEIPPTREHPQFTGRRSVPLTRDTAASFDGAIICTDHDPVDYRLLVAHCPLIIDTRNACARRGLSAEHVVKA